MFRSSSTTCKNINIVIKCYYNVFTFAIIPLYIRCRYWIVRDQSKSISMQRTLDFTVDLRFCKVRSEGKVVFDCEIDDSGEIRKRSWLIQAKTLSLSPSNVVFQLKTISSDSSGERVIQFTARWAKLTSLIPQNQPGTIPRSIRSLSYVNKLQI